MPTGVKHSDLVRFGQDGVGSGVSSESGTHDGGNCGEIGTGTEVGIILRCGGMKWTRDFGQIAK